jgi:hypothetical protein
MEKRHQVFISSTYKDLQEERQEVMHALLELDCIPSGMELFPAASEDQWTVIKTVIDECDYYVVIIAGKYGSLEASSGQSYTEREYRYALDQGKPIIAFLHGNPGTLKADDTELDPHIRSKLEDFRSLCQAKLCKFWHSPAELGSVVSRGIVQLKKSHPAVGWVRANLVPDEGAASAILRLQKRIETLEAELARSSTIPPPGTETLAQGEDTFAISCSYYQMIDHGSAFIVRRPGPKQQVTIAVSWNEIFGTLAPMLIDEASERAMHVRLGNYIAERNPWLSIDPNTFEGVSETSFEKIKVQLRALGLINKSARSHSIKDEETYWTLTPYGDAAMTKIHAIRRV